MSLWLTQATDEDSPPNNVLTYSIVYASQFRSFFSITMVEGYAGMWATLSNSHPLRLISLIHARMPVISSLWLGILILGDLYGYGTLSTAKS